MQSLPVINANNIANKSFSLKSNVKDVYEDLKKI